MSWKQPWIVNWTLNAENRTHITEQCDRWSKRKAKNQNQSICFPFFSSHSFIAWSKRSESSFRLVKFAFVFPLLYFHFGGFTSLPVPRLNLFSSFLLLQPYLTINYVSKKQSSETCKIALGICFNMILHYNWACTVSPSFIQKLESAWR